MRSLSSPLLPPFCCSDSALASEALANWHGGNIWAAARCSGAESGHICDLSTNTFFRMADHSAALIRSTLGAHALGVDFLHYPDPESLRLRHALAESEGVDPACLLPGGGASELIWAALIALRPRRALFIGPLFSQYARACDALGIPWDVLAPPPFSDPPSSGSGFTGGFAPDAALLEQVAASGKSGVDLVVACSPNNPGTGIMRDPRPLLDAVGKRTLLLDVSYKDFLDDVQAHSLENLARLAPACHIVLLGSLTKFYCCPGIRLGWLASDPEFAARAALCRPAWTVPALSEAVGLALLAHTPAYRAELPALRADVARLVAQLGASGLFRLVLPGVSFVLAALRDSTQAAALREYLLARHHILIRVCDNIPGMPPGFVRIQARPQEELLMEGLMAFRGICTPNPPGRGLTPLHPHQG